MGLIKGTFSGNVMATLNRRIAVWEAQQKIEAAIKSSQDWWYYNEFGTAGKAEIGSPPAEYPITPKDKPFLIFVAQEGYYKGQLRPLLRVTHRGIKASRSVTKALPDINTDVQKQVAAAINAGAIDDPNKLRDAALHSMQLAKKHIVESMSVHLGNYDDDDDPSYGRLKGRKPASVFDEDAKVEEIK